jgi:hypothetical protein
MWIVKRKLQKLEEDLEFYRNFALWADKELSEEKRKFYKFLVDKDILEKDLQIFTEEVIRLRGVIRAMLHRERDPVTGRFVKSANDHTDSHGVYTS